MLNVLFAYSQPADSLGYYLELAARNNPQINADFSLYKASLEKVPQAGAYPDPELEIGFFLKPMEILSGKQIADFTLMQMFPWFGTRKAARNEATEMARMAYEQFRNSRNNLYYEVKSQWYQLCNISEQYKNTQANLRLLDQLEQLALNRFSAPSAKAGGSSVLPSPVSSAPSTPPAVSGGGMSGMGGSSMGSPTVQSTGASGSTMSRMSGDSPMGGGSMGSGNSMGGMSDVLRIQMEKVELENTLASLLSQRKTAEAAFNTLLNQSLATPISVPDSLERLPLSWSESMALDSVISNNPMLTMLEAEGNAYRAKAEMDKKMSYPMLGIGLQYSLFDQKRKIEASGLREYFHHIEIMSDKKIDDYQRLIDTLGCPPEKLLMIGNSVKSDILPVLELGGYAAHVPYHVTWAYEQHEGEIRHPNFIRLDSIKGILDKL